MKNLYLTPLEREVFGYLHQYRNDGNLIDNSQIAKILKISEEQLLTLLNKIQFKISHQGSYYSD